MKFVRDELVGKTAKELLVIAKELQIVGRHEMKKAQLVEAIGVAQYEENLEENEERAADAERAVVTEDIERGMVENVEEEWDTKSEEVEMVNKAPVSLQSEKTPYISNAKIGTIIAFKVNNEKVISGMIEEIHKAEFVVKTRNGVKFSVRHKNVVWVKTGDRWPRGVYLALKGEAGADAYKRVN